MKIKVVSNKSDSYIGCNAYFCLNASDSALALVNEVFETFDRNCNRDSITNPII